MPPTTPIESGWEIVDTGWDSTLSPKLSSGILTPRGTFDKKMEEIPFGVQIEG